MMRLLKLFVQTSVVCLISLFMAIPVLAFPALPSGFYGEIRVNATNVPDGTVVRAMIEGKVYAEGYTQTYQDVSVYALDVPGDDADTTNLDGGREDDVIQFEIGGVLADQTGIWHSGTNVRLDLTASSTEPISTPQATPSPLPTQTPIQLATAVPTSTLVAQPSLTSIAATQSLSTITTTTMSSQTLIVTQPSPKSAALGQPSVISTPIGHSSPTPVSPLSSEEGGSNNNTVSISIVVAIIASIVVGGAIWIIRARTASKRKSSSK